MIHIFLNSHLYNPCSSSVVRISYLTTEELYVIEVIGCHFQI